jgi:hypothetical protein
VVERVRKLKAEIEQTKIGTGEIMKYQNPLRGKIIRKKDQQLNQ